MLKELKEAEKILNLVLAQDRTGLRKARIKAIKVAGVARDKAENVLWKVLIKNGIEQETIEDIKEKLTEVLDGLEEALSDLLVEAYMAKLEEEGEEEE